MRLPKLYRIRQALEYPLVADVAAEVRKALAQLDLASRLTPGARVAVTGGSRGVANIAIILRTVCDSLRGLGARPFIVPAMGSHGGATPRSSGTGWLASHTRIFFYGRPWPSLRRP